MKDYLREVVNEELSIQDNINRMREYIQKYFLYILYKRKIYKNLIFTGGTALRFFHNIKRFSEDLDFSLSYKAEGYDFRNMLEILEEGFSSSNYQIEVKYNIEKTVHTAFFKFPELLYECGLSSHRAEKISIKIEIDTNPPQGGGDEVTLYKSIFMFYILHYDLSSLFAGKIHALLCREYTKGRDWYDFLWYLTTFKEIVPNFTMLNNALKQTLKNPFQVNKKNWKSKLKAAVENFNIEKVKNDVWRFLEDPTEIELLTRDNLYKLIESHTQ